ncbi:hypothetical protein VIBNISOn1_1840090 [Vibrio nigripulchritudo SOn1]|uniref:Uncharacterized protein n=1 Tax=Vibrio nigripulchritudo SOn1 TaxID=1238450 RepID=A0AAV2VPT2_9VIBR|nr:hypothetical protein [Vibrio nigripulchritudo]CCO46707.1 hypothetical protein VIBNISOn1_1840090 [Vibrio nigripulchritudo SOn1]
MRNYIPYGLCTDYDELFDRVSEGEVIVAFVNASGFSSPPDILYSVCKISLAHGQILGEVSGTRYLEVSQDDVDTYNASERKENGTLKSLFIRDCQRLMLGWIKPKKEA